MFLFPIPLQFIGIASFRGVILAQSKDSAKSKSVIQHCGGEMCIRLLDPRDSDPV